MTNYLFGFIAIQTRNKFTSKVTPVYWILYLLSFFGMSSLVTWQMASVTSTVGRYWLASFAFYVLFDFIICDLIMLAILRNKSKNMAKFQELTNFLKFRGYYEWNKYLRFIKYMYCFVLFQIRIQFTIMFIGNAICKLKLLLVHVQQID